MKTFKPTIYSILAIYRGETVGSAQIVAVTTDPELVSYVTSHLLSRELAPDDPVIEKVDHASKIHIS